MEETLASYGFYSQNVFEDYMWTYVMLTLCPVVYPYDHPSTLDYIVSSVEFEYRDWDG
jgi:hypothetical protein